MGRFGPMRRVSLADVVYEDRWGQPLSDEPSQGGVSMND